MAGRQVTAELDFEPLIGGIDFAESPRWHDGRLWYADFYQAAVYAVTLDGQRERVCPVPGQPSGLGWLPDGRLLVVAMLEDRICRLEPGGELVVHADLSGIAFVPNDMVVGPDGTAYIGHFGYPHYRLPPDERGPVIASLREDGSAVTGRHYRDASLVVVRPDGSVWATAPQLGFPNGSVLTADGATLIVGETVAQRYTAYPVGADRLPVAERRRVWATVPGTGPDGCALDADGGIWFADVLRGRLRRVVEGGTVTHVAKPPMRPFACALGGPDGRTLFAACAPARSAVDRKGTADGVIFTATVPAPHAGWP
jgi:sugar lactone lactonase YvrE